MLGIGHDDRISRISIIIGADKTIASCLVAGFWISRKIGTNQVDIAGLGG
jgi:hypothetical protein